MRDKVFLQAISANRLDEVLVQGRFFAEVHQLFLPSIRKHHLPEEVFKQCFECRNEDDVIRNYRVLTQIIDGEAAVGKSDPYRGYLSFLGPPRLVVAAALPICRNAHLRVVEMLKLKDILSASNCVDLL